MLTAENKASRVAMCQAMLSREKGMDSAFFSSIVTMDETWMPILDYRIDICRVTKRSHIGHLQLRHINLKNMYYKTM
jgi:hypothetical protein